MGSSRYGRAVERALLEQEGVVETVVNWSS